MLEPLPHNDIAQPHVLWCLLAVVLSGCSKPEVTQNLIGKTQSPQALTPTQMLEDINYLVQTIGETHPNPFAYISKSEFESALFKTISACNEEMLIEDFYRHAAWLVGQYKNGHTKVLPPPCWNDYDGKIYPLYWKLDDDKVRLYAGTHLDKRYWGATVHTINGDSALEILRYYSALKPREARTYNEDIGLNSRFVWRCMALDYGDTAMELELVCRDGKAETIVVDAVAIDSLRSKPENQKTDTGQPSPVDYRYQEEFETGYLKIRFFHDNDLFRKQIKQAFADLRDKAAQNIIIDIRGCPGGVTSSAKILLDYLTDKEYHIWSEIRFRYSKLYQCQRGKHVFLVPTGSVRSLKPKAVKPTDNSSRFKGRVIVLINSRTCSTAVDFAGVVKYYKLGVLIGRETGDTMGTYGDFLTFKLPNSRLNCMVSCKYYKTIGTTRETATRGVMPDFPVISLLEDGWERRDKALEFAYKLCKKDTDNP